MSEERLQSIATAPPLGTLSEASAYLDGLINRERQADYAYARLDLRPIEALLAGIGHPERALSIIHVAGSKGKGSTCLFAEAILTALGERVGTFTSPHLESWVERFRIDGEPIDGGGLVEAVNRVRPALEKLRVGPRETRPSFFDATAAIAFLLFRDAGVDRAVIEVGLGGRLDSTNVVSPAVTCVTSIELEHTDKLGETEAAIAGEKAGILKPGVPVVVGDLREEAAAVVFARAEQVGAEVIAYGDRFFLEEASLATSAAAESFVLTAKGLPEVRARMNSEGRVARLNAALAVSCVRALGVFPEERVAAATRIALAHLALPGRVEVLPNDAQVIVDAAHTEKSILALVEVLSERAPRGYDLLLSVSNDKDIDRLLAPILTGAQQVWTTCAVPDRSLSAEVLADAVNAQAAKMALDLEVRVVPEPRSAAREARAHLSEHGVLVATGSVYLAGIARRVLGAHGEA